MYIFLHVHFHLFQRSHVFQRACKASARWVKLEESIRLELPRDTLFHAEIVTELRGEVSVLCIC